MDMNRKIQICHLFPDALNLYGDRGNVLCMQKRLEWRGIDCEVTSLHLGEHLDLTRFDLFFMGGGQDFDQEVLLQDLQGKGGREIKAAIEDGLPFLCICGGYQILGTHYEMQDGTKCEFLGAIDLYTVGGKKRLIGNYAYRLHKEQDLSGRTDEKPETDNRKSDKQYIVVGFENHSGRTYLGKGVRPLGTVLTGYGNNGTDHTEGVHERNVYGTYSHGPVLPKNPIFCDMILQCALKRKYGDNNLPPLDDTFETMAHDQVLKMIRG